MSNYGKIDPEVAEAIIKNYIESSKRRTAPNPFRQWVNPIRRGIDYQSTARKIFMVDKLPEVKCPECGYRFGLIYDHDSGEIHPNNGCPLGHVYNVMEV